MGFVQKYPKSPTLEQITLHSQAQCFCKPLVNLVRNEPPVFASSHSDGDVFAEMLFSYIMPYVIQHYESYVH